MPFLTPDAAAADDFICRRLRIPNDPSIIALVNGVITELLHEWAYEQHGDMTPADTVQMFQEMFEDYHESDVCMIGSIVAIATTVAPPNMLDCNGAIYQRADYPKLYDLLHPRLIISATEFKTPDMVGYFPIAAGGDLSQWPAHYTNGSFYHSLQPENIPPHSHTIQPHSHITHDHPPLPTIASVGVPPEAVTAAGPHFPASTQAAALSTDVYGAGEDVLIVPPLYTVRFCVVAK